MKYFKFYETIIDWLNSKLNARQFLIFSSMLVGITAGLAAVLLKSLVHYIHLAITYDYQFPFQNYLYLIFPLTGIVLTVYIIRTVLRNKLGRGTANIHRAIIKKSAFLPKDQMYSHVITSALTVGFGGSAGLESPIVTTGSAIGSNYARTYRLGYKDRVLLLACGAAAGTAAVFNAPIAGVLFALEVLLIDVSLSAFIPLMIAAALGTLCSKIILKEGILLSFDLQEPFNYMNVPFYLILGLLAGLVSVYYARTFIKIESLFPSRKLHSYRSAFVGGLALAALILVFPSLFGEGYASIKSLSAQDPGKLFEKSVLSGISGNEWFILMFVGVAMLLKVVAASITINSGGNGGNFAPSLFVGAYLGFFFSRVVNMLGLARLPESNFTIVAMAGILTGVFHAPLTGIFLIAEITGGYDLMVPLMLVSSTSYLVVKYFEPLSMDAKKLAKTGDFVMNDKDKTIISSLSLSEIIEQDFQVITQDAPLRDLVGVVARSKRNSFAVLDKQDRLVGIILLDNIREIMFKTELYDKVIVRELMRKPPAIVSLNEDMHSVMKKFDETGSWNLPVVSNQRYLGFVSKSALLTQYRSQLINTSAS